MPFGVVIVVVGRMSRSCGNGDGRALLLRLLLLLTTCVVRLLNALWLLAAAAAVAGDGCGGGDAGPALVGMPTIGFFLRRFMLYVMMLFWLSCTGVRECSPPESASRRPRRVASMGSTGTTCIRESPGGAVGVAANCSVNGLLAPLSPPLVLLCCVNLLCQPWLDAERARSELPMPVDDDSDDVDAERRSDNTRSFTSNAKAGWNCGSSAFTVWLALLVRLPLLLLSVRSLSGILRNDA